MLALLVVLAGAVGCAGRVSAQVGGERVVVTPGDGVLQTRFLFTGSGYAPGRIISVRVLPPDGSEHRLTTEDNAELIWLVQADGTFGLELVPSQRFPALGTGRWRILFCSAGASTCQLVEFDIVSGPR